MQTEKSDEILFPQFDKRVCLRCKKNDIISPNFCKYENFQNMEDLRKNSETKKLSHKTSKNHIYGTQLGWSKNKNKSPIKIY